MTVCSFLPAATQMLYSMHLQEHLCGVTFECNADKPRVVRSYLEGNNYSSEEINQIVSKSKAEGKSLYYIDEELLQALAPDIIFTQDVCDVCQIDTSLVQRAVFKLKKQPLIVPLLPKNLDDVFQNAITIATALGKAEHAHRHLAELKKRSGRILDALRMHNAPVRRVMLMEWLDPIYNCGHWIPDQIAQAGGIDQLSNPSGYSMVTPWEKVREYNPEVLVIAPCGYSIQHTFGEMNVLKSKEGWNELLAVQNKEVYVVDAEYFTQPGTTLVNGIELLAALFHPDLFEMSEQLQKHSMPVFKSSAVHE